MTSIQWWGYVHTNGSIQVKRWMGDPRDLQEAWESPFVRTVMKPFFASGRDEAHHQSNHRRIIYDS